MIIKEKNKKARINELKRPIYSNPLTNKNVANKIIAKRKKPLIIRFL